MSGEEAVSMLAVRDSIKTLGAIGDEESIEVLKNIYFSNSKNMSVGSITRAVNRFAAEAYLDERTVYRRIQRAAKIYRFIMEKNQESA